MKILIDITHPAHVHFFKNLIYGLKVKHEIFITIREKTITSKLLKELGFNYYTLGKFRNNFFKLIKMPEITFKLILLMKKEGFTRKDIAMGIAPINLSMACKFSNVKCFAFDDTDFSPEQYYLYNPFCDYLFVPYWFPLLSIGNQMIKYHGGHEFTYLNENRFKPNREVLKKYNLMNKRYLLIRLIKWDATHDIRYHGANDILQILEKMKEKYEIVITSEYNLPVELKKFEYKGDLLDFHDLIAFSEGYIGEAITTAQESIVLHKPTILVNPLKCELFQELKRNNYSLFYQANSFKEGFEKFLEIMKLNNDNKNKEYQRFFGNYIDFTPKMIKIIEKLVDFNF